MSDKNDEIEDLELDEETSADVKGGYMTKEEYYASKTAPTTTTKTSTTTSKTGTKTTATSSTDGKKTAY